MVRLAKSALTILMASSFSSITCEREEQWIWCMNSMFHTLNVPHTLLFFFLGGGGGGKIIANHSSLVRISRSCLIILRPFRFHNFVRIACSNSATWKNQPPSAVTTISHNHICYNFMLILIIMRIRKVETRCRSIKLYMWSETHHRVMPLQGRGVWSFGNHFQCPIQLQQPYRVNFSSSN